MIADPSCPWCLVGWRALGRARDMGAAPDFARVWRPYLLFARMPAGGIDRAAFYAQRAATDPDRFAASRAALEDAARGAGLEVDFQKPARMPNVIDAQRLILWATGQGLGETAADAVLDAYWLRGDDIGDRDTLAALAREIGLNGEVVADLLASDADRDTILSQHLAASRGGVTGVPATLYDRKLSTLGAQTPAQHLAAIAAAHAQGTKT